MESLAALRRSKNQPDISVHEAIETCREENPQSASDLARFNW
jgi:hypothetical protein